MVEKSRIIFSRIRIVHKEKKYENLFNFLESEWFSSNSVTKLMPNTDSALISSKLLFLYARKSTELDFETELKRRGTSGSISTTNFQTLSRYSTENRLELKITI